MFKIGDILMLEPKYTPQKEKFNCMVVEMGTGCFYMDFPIDVETGKLHSLWMGHSSMSHFPMKSRLFMYSSLKCLESER